MNEEVKVSTITKVMEEMKKTLGDLNSTIDTLGVRLRQVLMPELTNTKDAPTNPMPANPLGAVGPLVQQMQDDTLSVELARKRIQCLMDRLEV